MLRSKICHSISGNPEPGTNSLAWLYTINVNRFYALAGLLAIATLGCSKAPDANVSSTQTTATASNSDAVPGHSEVPAGTPSKPGTEGKAETTGSTKSEPGVAKNKLAERAIVPEDAWKASKVTADELFHAVEAKMTGLDHASVHVTTMYKGEKGHGTSNSTVSLVDKKKYRVEYPDFTGTRPVQYAIVKNGEKSTVMKAGGPGDVDMTHALPSKFEGPLLQWFDAFPIQVFSTTWGGTPLTDFLAVAKKAGASIKVDERQFDFKGHIFHQKRVTIRGQNDRGHTLDQTIVVDDEHVLPVTIDTAQDLGKAGESLIHWTSGWDLQKDQKFDPKLFEIAIPKK